MRVDFLQRFEKDVLYYFKKRKYTKIRQDISPVIRELENGNLVGDKIDNLGLLQGNVYKVRIPNSSANEGKSNGFRILYYAVVDDRIYLLTIYSKKDDGRILNDNQIANIVKNMLKEP